MAEDKSKQATDELDPKEFCNRRILPACGIYLTSISEVYIQKYRNESDGSHLTT